MDIFVALAFVFAVWRVIIGLTKKAAGNQGKNVKKPASPTIAPSTKSGSLNPHEEAAAKREIAAAKASAMEKVTAKKAGQTGDTGVMKPDIAPQVAASVRVSPHNHENMFAGSMDSDHTGEGADPCHPISGVSQPMPSAPAAAYSAYDEPEPTASSDILPGWTGSDILRGIIMQEVLNRPSPKHYGKRQV